MKVNKLLILLIISVLPLYVFALNGSINVNKSSMTLEIGKSEMLQEKFPFPQIILVYAQ